MAAKSARKSATTTTTRKPRRKKAEPKSRGLTVPAVASEAITPPPELVEGIPADGGEALSVYGEPPGGTGRPGS